MTTYTHRPWQVAAIEWTGSNVADVSRFLVEHFGDDCGIRYGDDEYNMVQFEAWGDDQEVDPGRWIVVHLGVDAPTGEVMYPDDFRTAYESAGGR